MQGHNRLLAPVGETFETLWVRPAGQDLYEIGNIPFLVYNRSLGYLVRAVERDGVLQLTGVYDKSGQRTLRVLLDRVGTKTAEDRRCLLEALRRPGVQFERLHDLLAISIAQDGPLQDVLAHLGSDRDSWRWEHADPQSTRPTLFERGSPAYYKREAELLDIIGISLPEAD